MNKALVVAASASLAVASWASAAPVTDWHTFRASPATTLSGQGTDDPIMGGPTAAETSSNGFLVGYLSQPVTLANEGDFVTLTFNVSFNDDAGGTVGGGDNFRFALFNLNGQTPVTADNTATAGVDGQTDNWRGYWCGHKGGGGAGINGSIRERSAAL